MLETGSIGGRRWLRSPFRCEEVVADGGTRATGPPTHPLIVRDGVRSIYEQKRTHVELSQRFAGPMVLTTHDSGWVGQKRPRTSTRTRHVLVMLFQDHNAAGQPSNAKKTTNGGRAINKKRCHSATARSACWAAVLPTVAKARVSVLTREFIILTAPAQHPSTRATRKKSVHTPSNVERTAVAKPPCRSPQPVHTSKKGFGFGAPFLPVCWDY